MEGVVMALTRPRVQTRPSPRFWLVGEVKGQALVDVHLREVALAWLDCQAEDLGEEPGGGYLVFRWHDGVVQANRHCPPPDAESNRPSYAFFNASTLIFFIFRIAAMTRLDFSRFLFCSILPKNVGTSYHDTQHLSLRNSNWTS